MIMILLLHGPTQSAAGCEPHRTRQYYYHSVIKQKKTHSIQTNIYKPVRLKDDTKLAAGTLAHQRGAVHQPQPRTIPSSMTNCFDQTNELALQLTHESLLHLLAVGSCGKY